MDACHRCRSPENPHDTLCHDQLGNFSFFCNFDFTLANFKQPCTTMLGDLEFWSLSCYGDYLRFSSFTTPFFSILFAPRLQAYGIAHNPPFVIALISSELAPCTNLERSYVSGRTVYDGNSFETVLLALLRLLFPCVPFPSRPFVHIILSCGCIISSDSTSILGSNDRTAFQSSWSSALCLADCHHVT